MARGYWTGRCQRSTRRATKWTPFPACIGGVPLPAVVRLETPAAAVLVVFGAVPDAVVFHHVSAVSLSGGPAGGGAGGAGRLVDGAKIRGFHPAAGRCYQTKPTAARIGRQAARAGQFHPGALIAAFINVRCRARNQQSPSSHPRSAPSPCRDWPLEIPKAVSAPRNHRRGAAQISPV